MTHDMPGRTSRAHVKWPAACLVMGAFFAAQPATAAPPTATGQSAAVSLFGGEINLRSQGALAGSAPMVISSATVLPVDAPVIATPTTGVCLQIENLQEIDYAQAGVQLQLVVMNADAPTGAIVTIPLVEGTGNDDLAACADPNSPPVANAGVDQTLPDTDGLNGETVVLDGSDSFDSDGTIVSYQWVNVATGQTLGTTASLTTTLPDGVNVIELTVMDDSGATGTDQVTITVQAGMGPTVDAGPNQTIPDTDGVPGELVTLTGTATPVSGSTIVSYMWFEADQVLGQGPTLTIRLDDGVHEIELLVVDSNQNTGSDTVTITVGVEPEGTPLGDLTGLTSNQRSLADAFDELCERLAQTQTPNSDLLERCNALRFDTDPANQRQALDQIGAEDLSALQSQTLVFSNTQTSSVMERLLALRGGAKGLSLGNFSINLDGQPVPLTRLAMLGQLVGEMLGVTGGSDEEDGPGSLLGDRLGLWARGSYGDMHKRESPDSPDYKSKQMSFTLGADYRFTPNIVAGFSAGYGDSALDYRGGARGGLDTSGWTAAIYGSAYAVGNFYVDGLLNYGRSHYRSERHIRYLEGTTLIDRTAVGSTDGTTTSGALALGYDFQWGALTLSPNASYLYTESDIDRLREDGAGGLNLIIDRRRFEASTATFGLRAVYALSFRWGVLLPHFRGEFVRELQADTEVFGVRFADDPFADSGNPTPPIVVYSDTPDRSYWKLTVGSSAQFKHGISAYVEYQKLESFQYMSFRDFTVGLRLQRSF